MSFVDVPSRLTSKQLDDLKHVAATAMRRTADLTRAKGKTVIEAAYAEAHRGVLRAQTEDEVERIERDFSKALIQLKQVFDVFDQA